MFLFFLIFGVAVIVFHICVFHVFQYQYLFKLSGLLLLISYFQSLLWLSLIENIYFFISKALRETKDHYDAVCYFELVTFVYCLKCINEF